MDKEQRSARARSLVNDEMFDIVFNEIEGSITKRLLNATTPEDRESRFHEYQGVKRARDLLKRWAAEAK